ncbi:MAG: 50S ribosomal protein L10 [Oscillospiraceae bacterium]|jgi:large subunit ribosomal protein L10|nr:50S ribosomal protein L10 [Oscillospiraceae bacterium]
MPNAKVLSEKKATVEALTGRLGGLSGVLVDYSGITVAEDTELRARMRAENVDYAVVKNTLLRFAVKNVGFEALEPILNGTTSMATSMTDAVSPAKIIKEYSAKLAPRFVIKGGFYDGKVISVAEVESLASIPALPVLQARVLGTMLAPITSLAVVLKAIAEKQGAPEPEQAPVEAAPAEAAEAPAETAESPAESEAPAETAAEETPAEAATEEAPAEESPAEPEPAEETPAEADAAPEPAE